MSRVFRVNKPKPILQQRVSQQQPLGATPTSPLRMNLLADDLNAGAAHAAAAAGSARLPTVTANRLPGADRHRPPSSIGATATVLNLPHCYGMLDKDERKQYSVHAWLLKAAAAAVQSATAFMRASISFCRRLPIPNLTLTLTLNLAELGLVTVRVSTLPRFSTRTL